MARSIKKGPFIDAHLLKKVIKANIHVPTANKTSILQINLTIFNLPFNIFM